MFSGIFDFFKKIAGGQKGNQQLLENERVPSDHGNTENPRLRECVQELIAQCDTVRAIDLMIEAGMEDAAMYKSQWLTNDEDYEERKITFEANNRTRNRINYSLLQLFEPRNEERSLASELWSEEKIEPLIKRKNSKLAVNKEQADEIRRLIEEKGLEEALNACAGWSDDCFLIQARFHNLKRNWSLGLISNEELNDYNNQFKLELTSLLDDQATEANS